MSSFRAFVSRKDEQGTVAGRIETVDIAALPDGEVTIAIDHAGFNYKDALCLTGRGNLVRSFPHVAGIDFAGSVLESTDARYRKGDAVVLTGWRVGETHWGGFAERARVKADWLVPLPQGMSTRQSMVLGTAGLTAMLAIQRLEDLGLAPHRGEILVTGAGGGVGSMAIQLLARLGYSPVALSGRAELAKPLTELGADRILARSDLLDGPDKPLDSARFAGAIDTVGGAILGRLLKQIQPHGAVAALGNAAGIEFETSVLPFILRGVTLSGIDSVTQPFETRQSAWRRLAAHFDFAGYEGWVEEIGLEALPQTAERILNGQVRGRVIVSVT